MSAFVVDASVLVSWLLPDESDVRSDALFADPANQWLAPSHLPAEVGNVLLQSVRRGRLKAEEMPNLASVLICLDVQLENFGFGPNWSRATDLAVQHTLTLYDALYLEMAQRLNLPLASFDRALVRAAEAAGVDIA